MFKEIYYVPQPVIVTKISNQENGEQKMVHRTAQNLKSKFDPSNGRLIEDALVHFATVKLLQ